MQTLCNNHPDDSTPRLTEAQRKIYAKGVLPRTIARRTGLSDACVSRTLRGLSRNPVAQKRIADAVGMSPRQLFGRLALEKGGRHAA